jgi:hypothetical protein
MPLGRRMLRARQRRDARALGFEAALGLADEPPSVRHPSSVHELRCARCDGASQLENLDLRTGRGLARCDACGQTWSILYPSR